jgi:hypothetical protein
MKKFFYRMMESLYTIFTSEKKIVAEREVVLQMRKTALKEFEREKKHINFYSTKKRYQKA